MHKLQIVRRWIVQIEGHNQTCACGPAVVVYCDDIESPDGDYMEMEVSDDSGECSVCVTWRKYQWTIQTFLSDDRHDNVYILTDPTYKGRRLSGGVSIGKTAQRMIAVLTRGFTW